MSDLGQVWVFLSAATTLALWVVLLRSARSGRAQAEASREARDRVAAILRPGEELLLDRLLLGEIVPRRHKSYAGRLASGREARVTTDKSPISRSSTVELACPRAPRIQIRERGAGEEDAPGRLGRWLDFDTFLVTTLDTPLVRRAFGEHSELRGAIREVLRRFPLEQLRIWEGRLTARVSQRLSPQELRALLEKLDAIAASFEPVPVRVRIFGGERQAIRGFGGSPRCAYCHDGITGEEPDLVACEKCHTVLHAACWQDLGRCPVLGCDGREPERPSPDARELGPERESVSP